MGLIDGVLAPVYSGCPAYLMSPTAFLQRRVRWLRAISRYRVTRSGAPNFAYDLCVAQARSGGTRRPRSPQLARRLQRSGTDPAGHPRAVRLRVRRQRFPAGRIPAMLRAGGSDAGDVRPLRGGFASGRRPAGARVVGKGVRLRGRGRHPAGASTTWKRTTSASSGSQRRRRPWSAPRTSSRRIQRRPGSCPRCSPGAAWP